MKKCKTCGQEIVQIKHKTLKIPALKIEVETEIHDTNKCLKDIKIPKGWRLLKVEEMVFLFNNYKKELNLRNTWEFIEQPFNEFKGKCVAGFAAGSDWTDLVCYWNPDYRVASLGVRFCRGIKK